MALPFAGSGEDQTLVGIAVYRSTDGGRTWSPPKLLHTSSNDDKQTATEDRNPTSPHFGSVYAAWDDGPDTGPVNLAFARTTDNGATWIGLGNQPPGTHLAGIPDSFCAP